MRTTLYILALATAAAAVAAAGTTWGCSSRKKTAHGGSSGSGTETAEKSACLADLKPFYAADRRRLTDEEQALKNLQFYLSREVVLKRVLTMSEVKVTPHHRLRFIKGKHYETITIKCGTPGVVKEVDPMRVNASFDPKSPKSLLPFEPVGEDKAVFCLQASWPDADDDDKDKKKQKEGTVYYEGKKFFVAREMKFACLFVRKESREKRTEAHKELKGVKLPHTPAR